jgi:septal ring factor EnvC (AmiA/AmiB activator)
MSDAPIDPSDSTRNELLREILEAVRALNPADLSAMTAHRDSLEDERNKLDFQCKVQLAEVERLQKLVQDQALTIGTLKDENRRHVAMANATADELDRLRAELDRHSRELSAEQGLSAHQGAELKRFRERIAELETLVDDNLNRAISAEMRFEHVFGDHVPSTSNPPTPNRNE